LTPARGGCRPPANPPAGRAAWRPPVRLITLCCCCCFLCRLRRPRRLRRLRSPPSPPAAASRPPPDSAFAASRLRRAPRARSPRVPLRKPGRAPASRPGRPASASSVPAVASAGAAAPPRVSVAGPLSRPPCCALGPLTAGPRLPVRERGPAPLRGSGPHAPPAAPLPRPWGSAPCRPPGTGPLAPRASRSVLGAAARAFRARPRAGRNRGLGGRELALLVRGETRKKGTGQIRIFGPRVLAYSAERPPAPASAWLPVAAGLWPAPRRRSRRS